MNDDWISPLEPAWVYILDYFNITRFISWVHSTYVLWTAEYHTLCFYLQNMDRSVFGSAIKTYPSKNNRTSRYYRPSSCILQQTNVFDDDEPPGDLDLFDKLVNEEKARSEFSNVLSNRTASSHVGNATSRKSSFYPVAPVVLQSIQNVDVDVKRSSRSSTLNKFVVFFPVYLLKRIMFAHYSLKSVMF